MEVNVVVKKKDELELEFTEKEVPIALVSVLQDAGVDAYWYEPHPLKEGFRIHVSGESAMEDVKKAIKNLESDVSQLQKAIVEKLK
jgi:DNA-directed RNA polymerase subunit L